MRKFAFILWICCGLAWLWADNPVVPDQSSGNVLQQFYYTDGNKLVTPLFGPDGKTPLPDGCLLEIALTMKPNTADFKNDPHGLQLRNRWGGYSYTEQFTNGVQSGMRPGFFCTPYFIWIDPFNSATEPAAQCKHHGDATGDQIYLRLYDAPSADQATHVRLSEFFDAPEAGTAPMRTEIVHWSDWMPIPGK